jgi:phosphoserine phosphatase
VRIAAGHWGFTEEDIAAVVPATTPDGRIAPRLRGEVPYGPHKTRLGQRLLGTARWLAAFGDNAFDTDMLEAADLGVAVRPKAALRERLNELEGVIELVE